MRVVGCQWFVYFMFFSFGVFAGWLVTKWNAVKEQIHRCETCNCFKEEIRGVSVGDGGAIVEQEENPEEVTKPWMARIPKEDMEILGKAADRYDLQGDARYLLFAIYIVENGGSGREMGVVNSEAQRFKGDHKTSLRIQAEWAAGTIQKRFHGWGSLRNFAEIWAPVGAKNDPKGFNRYWLPNVQKIMAEMVG